MQSYNRSTPRNNPRLILTVNTDESATVKGCIIDSRDNVASHTRTYNSEAQAVEALHNMRESGAEFSYTINRKA
jgi:uncharacterized protein YfcZ (UPF0381/DUF406 family)